MDRAPAGAARPALPALLDPIEVDTFCSGTARAVGGALEPRPQRRRAGRARRRALGAPASPTARARARCPTASTPSTGRRRAAAACARGCTTRAAPPPDAPARPWRFRGADLDPAGHVNNAVYWAALEEELVADEPAGGLEAEVEHRAAAGTGEAAVLHDGPMRWITGADGARGGDAQAGSLNASSRERRAPVLDRRRASRSRSRRRPRRRRRGAPTSRTCRRSAPRSRSQSIAAPHGPPRGIPASSARVRSRAGTSAKSITWPSSCRTTVARSPACARRRA